MQSSGFRVHLEALDFGGFWGDLQGLGCRVLEYEVLEAFGFLGFRERGLRPQGWFLSQI